jgi:alcohol dehydrogenase
MPAFARAVEFTGPGQPLSVLDFEVPAVGPGEILVRVACCTICGSDVHSYRGRRSVAVPTILGHEIIGRIIEFGANAVPTDLFENTLHIGDRITWTIAASCGACFYCDNELPQKCVELFKYGHELLKPGHQFHGGLADVCLLRRGTGIARLPDRLPDFVACPANCATATVAAALRAAGDCRGRTILVHGAGMLGVTACAMARAAGAREIVCTDINAERLALASGFGATRAVLADGLGRAVEEATAGRGVDVALELSGSADAAQAGLDLLRIGGTAVWLGAVLPVRPVPINPEAIVRRMLTIRGVHNYSPRDLAAAVTFLDRHHRDFPFAELVAGPYSLADADRAFQKAGTGTAARVAITPDIDDPTRES